MDSNIINLVDDSINRKSLLNAHETVLLAISGGADSMGLLAIFNELKTAGLIDVNIHIAHINHLLRDDKSDADEEFVIETAKKMGVPISTRKVDVKTFAGQNKLSIETAARNLRQTALCEIATANNCAAIATAHHKNDNAETIIHRLGRGTGYTGCAGIKAKSKIKGQTFIRPLLDITKNQIEEYLKSKNLSWQIDHTNVDTKFTRNHIRAKLIPQIQKDCQDRLEDTLYKLAHNCQKLSNKIETAAKKTYQNICTDSNSQYIEMNLKNFNAQPEPIQIELIRLAIKVIKLGQQNFTYQTYQDIINFAKTAQNNKLLSLPKNYSALKTRDAIIFQTPKNKTQDNSQQQIEIPIPGKINFGQWTIETKLINGPEIDLENFKAQKDNLTEWFDAEAISLPITARHRQPGDTFEPFGHENSKKIGKFLTTCKITPKERENVFLISDIHNNLWLCPLRAAKIARITSYSEKTIQISVKKHDALVP